MMSTIDADDDWCPPTLTPEVFGRPRLAASTIAAESHSTRCEISRSVAVSSLVRAGPVMSNWLMSVLPVARRCAQPGSSRTPTRPVTPGSTLDGVVRPADGVRIAELVATLSYAADLGLGQPMDHCLRETVIALRLADLVGADRPQREATYYLGLMIGAYCHADAAEQASWFGDDIEFKATGFELLDMDTAQVVGTILRRLSSHGTGIERVRRIAALPVTARSRLSHFLETHATIGAQMAGRLGLAPAVQVAVGQAYEQWDGRGFPRGLRGEDICLATRVVPVAGAIEIFGRRRGTSGAVEVVRRHRGGQYDPGVVDAFCDHADTVLDGLDEAATWDAVLDLEPWPHRCVDGPELDAALEAIADGVDLKSPHLAGHSRGVSLLAAEAARVWGLGEAEVTTVRRAGLVHDLGRLGVSNAVWDKPGPLTEAERERSACIP